MTKPILDVCCGGKMFWFDKNNANVEFCDKRTVEKHEFYPHRYFEVKPDVECDFTNLPFSDNSFSLVVFDPPHLKQPGETSWLALKYGKLDENWPTMLKQGFDECMRVLCENGTLIFKWSEVEIPVKDIIRAIQHEPLFGHRSGKNSKTHWLCFMKMEG